MNFYEKVYATVKQIPRGNVATYGQIARLCGSPRASRAVGYALHANPYNGIVPCHRVINRYGRLAEGFVFGGPEEQKKLLNDEGVAVSADFHVDLKIYGWWA